MEWVRGDFEWQDADVVREGRVQVTERRKGTWY